MKTNHHNAGEFLLGVMTLEILKATGGVDGKAEEESKGILSSESVVEVRHLSQS